ncbi:MAG: GNAT family N-acetyltransferase [Planctomycetaceae bacterium]
MMTSHTPSITPMALEQFKIRPLSIDDYDSITALWQKSEGVALSSADSREAISLYLERNPGLSQVAICADQIVGTLLCGHDGRRGYLHHLAVEESYRSQGIATALVNKVLQNLADVGIEKCHLLVLNSNAAGIEFWNKLGWEKRDRLSLFSHECG